MAIRRGVGLVLALVLVACLVSFGGLLAIWLVVGAEPTVPSRSTLVLRIDGDPVEGGPDDGFAQFLPVRRAHSIRMLVENVRKAKVDRRVAAMVVRPSGLSSPYTAKIQELRDAILDFRRSGKPVVAYLEDGDQLDYYLATACDRIFLLPSSPLQLVGLGQLRGLPARHARQGRRLPRPDAHRRVQDRVQPADREDVHGGAPRDGAVAQRRDLRPARQGDRRRPEEERGGRPHAARRGAVPAGGRARRRPDRRPGVRGSDRREGEDPVRPRQDAGSRRLRPGQRDVARPRARAAHRGHLRVGHDRLGPQRLRPAERGGPRLGHAHRLHPQGPRGERHQGGRASHRQPRRLGGRLRRHLARAGADARREAGPPVRRLDVGPGGLGRLLHGDGRAADRRRARHADRLDRDLRRQVRHRRRVRQARAPTSKG